MQYELLFDIQTIHKEPMESFYPSYNKNRHKFPYQKLLINNDISTDDLYLLRLRPKSQFRVGNECELDKADLSLFHFFHQQLSHSGVGKEVAPLLKSWFSNDTDLIHSLLSKKMQVRDLTWEDYGRLYKEIVKKYRKILEQRADLDQAVAEIDSPFFTRFAEVADETFMMGQRDQE